jgi:hypothetical protein
MLFFLLVNYNLNRVIREGDMRAEDFFGVTKSIASSPSVGEGLPSTPQIEPLPPPLALVGDQLGFLGVKIVILIMILKWAGVPVLFTKIGEGFTKILDLQTKMVNQIAENSRHIENLTREVAELRQDKKCLTEEIKERIGDIPCELARKRNIQSR